MLMGAGEVARQTGSHAGEPRLRAAEGTAGGFGGL